MTIGIAGFRIPKEDRKYSGWLSIDLLTSPMLKTMRQLRVDPMSVSMAFAEEELFKEKPELLEKMHYHYEGNPMWKRIPNSYSEAELQVFMGETLRWFSDLCIELGHVKADLMKSIEEQGYSEGNSVLLQFINELSENPKLSLEKHKEGLE